MLFDFISILLGLLKIGLYKIFYFRRVFIRGIPKMNASFVLGIKRGSSLSIGNGFRSRNNVSFRIYDKGQIVLGNNVFLNDNCSINARKKIEIGNHVIIGPGVFVYDHDHDFKSNDIENNFVSEEIVIGNNVWIGANSIILKGSVIGDGSVIAAGTIVKGNIPAGSMVYDKRDQLVKVIQQK